MKKNFVKGRIIQKFGSQWKFATAINVQESIVSKVLNGRRKLDQDGKKTWARALDCKPEDLFEAN